MSIVDSGIAASLLGVDESRLSRLDGPIGGLLESFVAMEIARQLSWSHHDAEVYHYRTRDQTEVDLVLEDSLGEVVALQVKASADVGHADFRGLRHLEARLGPDFKAGFVLYLGAESLRFGPRMRALPMSALWEAGRGWPAGAPSEQGMP
jgi:predicted AAA+ superfamily ATPase